MDEATNSKQSCYCRSKNCWNKSSAIKSKALPSSLTRLTFCTLLFRKHTWKIMKFIVCCDQSGNTLRLYWQRKVNIALYPHRKVYVCTCVLSMCLNTQKSVWVQQGKYMYSIQLRLDTNAEESYMSSSVSQALLHISFWRNSWKMSYV